MSEMTILRELHFGDRGPLEEILRKTGVFTEDEVDVALELIDSVMGAGAGGGDGYEMVVAERLGRVVGYACWGRTPMTEGTYDLYWIAVDPALQGHGVGRAIVAEVERSVRADHGRLIVVETAGKESYAPTRAFYEGIGYPEHCRIKDFYRPGDDKVIQIKEL